MEIQVTECDNCPFCNENDMDFGFNCRLSSYLNGWNPKNRIEDDGKNTPITPIWCPLKKEHITIQFKEQKDGTD